jgi:hypothetical protein
MQPIDIIIRKDRMRIKFKKAQENYELNKQKLNKLVVIETKIPK